MDITKTQQTRELNNNESMTRGVFPQDDGTFLALTYSASKPFKTAKGALRWFKKWTGQG